MSQLVRQFRDPGGSLGGLDATAAARIIAAAADLALVVDANGVINDFAFESRELAQELQRQGSLLGRPWIETVTVESRTKVQALLNDAVNQDMPRWRHVNFPASRGRDVPILCSALQVQKPGPFVVIGRDLRSLATLQQKLVDAQQSMEQDYARLRHAETRYRLLFQLSAEAVLIVEATTGRIVDANPAACALFEQSAKTIVGRVFPFGFGAEGAKSIQEMLDGVRITGHAEEIRACLADGTSEYFVTADLFRQDGALSFIVRLRSTAMVVQAASPPNRDARLAEVLEHGPDGFVVTLPDGQIVAANDSFLAMVELATEEQVRGESLDRWIGKPGVEVNVLGATLRQRGSVRLFRTTLHGEYGAATEVEISAVAVAERDQTCFGFAIRDVGPRPSSEGGTGRELPRSVDQMTELVGRLSLKDIVRETTDVIERLCIQAALELSRDNRALAAEMLGLSRQSLYVKMRRFGLAETDAEAEKHE